MTRIRAITVNTAIARKLIELFNLVYTLYDIIYMAIVMLRFSLFLDKWFCKFQCHQHRVDNDNNYNNRQHHYFIVNHDINMNFSIALKAFLEALIEPIIKRPVKFNNLTQNAISFSFETLPNCC